MQNIKIILLLVLVNAKIYAQNGQGMEQVLESMSTYELVDLLRQHGSDSTMQGIRQQLEFKIPIFHPLSKLRLTSSYGNRVHPIEGKVKFHNGIDIAARYNQPVYATADGQVIELGYQAGLGNFIKIKHLLGFETVYGHLNGFAIQLHATVYQGQTIGFCGSTGNSTGVHLHYSVLRFKGYLNPLWVI
jgi:murein DD-endopeptidase MepM/ murein hydrolase activator NlpD